MDRITEQLLREFAVEYNLGESSSDEQFEHFVNLAIVTREYPESFNPSDVHVGKDSNPGIDGLAVIVNGTLVDDTEEIDNLVATNKSLDASFVFTQAKTSSSFNGGDIGSFIEAVRDFFRDEHKLVRGRELAEKATLQEHIFKLSGKMRANPTCSLYYVTTGTWNGDKNLQARLDQGKVDLEQTQLFSNVVVAACGAADIQKLYRQGRESVDVEIEFPNKVTPPFDSWCSTGFYRDRSSLGDFSTN